MLFRSASALEKRLGHRFRRRELLQQALTHRSYANEKGQADNNERLELLGDAVLGLVTVEWLYRGHPEVNEGDLSKLKGRLVSEPVLAGWAAELGLGTDLQLGVGEDRSGGRTKSSILADAMEAVIGAVFLDAGLPAARRVVIRMLETERLEGPAAADDAKTRLQELVQAKGWKLPAYRLVSAEGPDHRKVFTVECVVRGEIAGSGEGRSKKRAERRAALEALARISHPDS